jgi:hypothetical protein
VEWAERIKVRVMAEFDRVAAAFHVVATKQEPAAQASTQAIIAILEEIRAEVMRNEEAGYFIHDWQDISDQVRRLIFSDPRYQTIKNGRSRRAPALGLNRLVEGANQSQR